MTEKYSKWPKINHKLRLSLIQEGRTQNKNLFYPWNIKERKFDDAYYQKKKNSFAVAANFLHITGPSNLVGGYKY